MKRTAYCFGGAVTLAFMLVGLTIAVAGNIPFVAMEKSPWAIATVITEHPLALSGDDFPHANLTADDVTDRDARFVADPFLIKRHGLWYLFFEVLEDDSGQGDIAVAVSDDGEVWQYRHVVLDEPFHLSFPTVFTVNGEVYMVPESYQARQIRLYHADHFPDEWSLDTVLLDGKGYLDSSVFRRDDRWWLLTSLYSENSSSLYLYASDGLRGPWREHPESPVVVNDRHHARLAGSVKPVMSNLMRFTQDIEPEYGKRVTAYRIDSLTSSAYEEHAVGKSALVGGTSDGWNAKKMHHFFPARMASGKWLVASDGVASDHFVLGWDK